MQILDPYNIPTVQHSVAETARAMDETPFVAQEGLNHPQRVSNDMRVDLPEAHPLTALPPAAPKVFDPTSAVPVELPTAHRPEPMGERKAQPVQPPAASETSLPTAPARPLALPTALPEVHRPVRLDAALPAHPLDRPTLAAPSLPVSHAPVSVPAREVEFQQTAKQRTVEAALPEARAPLALPTAGREAAQPVAHDAPALPTARDAFALPTGSLPTFAVEHGASAPPSEVHLHSSDPWIDYSRIVWRDGPMTKN